MNESNVPLDEDSSPLVSWGAAAPTSGLLSDEGGVGGNSWGTFVLCKISYK
jgi:hypothetical protein